MDVYERLARAEAMIQELLNRTSNAATRGVLLESDDGNGAQRQRMRGFYGEELTDVQHWQPFGLSASAPPGADVLAVCLGGNRDGTQVICTTHPDHRPTGQLPGETTLYDAGGQKVTLNSSGITIADQFGSTVTMASGGVVTIAAADVKIKGNLAVEGGTMTHNGKNVGDDHRHLNSSGPSTGGVPE